MAVDEDPIGRELGFRRAPAPVAIRGRGGGRSRRRHLVVSPLDAAARPDPRAPPDADASSGLRRLRRRPASWPIDRGDPGWSAPSPLPKTEAKGKSGNDRFGAGFPILLGGPDGLAAGGWGMVVMSGMGEPLLRVEDLRTYIYLDEGIVRAANGVSFTLDRGQTMAIVGESGSGKSIVAQSIMRILPPRARIEAGRMRFSAAGGTPVDLASLEPDGRAMRAIRGGAITMVFQ